MRRIEKSRQELERTLYAPATRFYTWAQGFANRTDSWTVIKVHDGDQFIGNVLWESKPGPWASIEHLAERAERVCERLNRSTLAVAAAELEPDGLMKLFKHCWEEDEREYSENGQG